MPRLALALLLAATAAAGAPRAEICLNGIWDTVLDAGEDAARIPAASWTPRRAPAMPLTAVSAWYRRTFEFPRAWFVPERRFILRIAKAGHYAAIWCNGRRLGEHYGQFTPFEADLTAALRAGAKNEIAIYVHNASGKYVRPGVVLDDALNGNAYRGASDLDPQRNWIGIAGDITLAWRPAAHIADVVVVTSVREKRLEARVAVEGAAGLMVRAAVLDGGRVVSGAVLRPVQGGSETRPTLASAWSDPVLWEPASPKLYTLRTELVRNGKVVDRSFTRFGFREVWIDGRDVLLNGRKLWMSGTYFGKIAPIRYLNDRHPQALILDVLLASGMNTLHGHWDELGDTWLDLCDEMGVMVLGGFYCDGRPKIQSHADPGWADWMAQTCASWVRVARRHPSIVLWRPTDVVPPNMAQNRTAFAARMAEQVRREDGTRPLADDSDIAAWSQSLQDYDDGARLAQRLASEKRPLLTKEIYGGFADVPKVSAFFRAFYEKSRAGGATGVITQHVPLVQNRARLDISWLSDSGLGNRDHDSEMRQMGLPNWCDATQPAWEPSPMSRLFAELRVGNPATAPSRAWGEVLIQGLRPDELAVLAPPDESVGETIGVRASATGEAWVVAPPGSYRLRSAKIEIRPAPAVMKPGYAAVPRVRAR